MNEKQVDRILAELKKLTEIQISIVQTLAALRAETSVNRFSLMAITVNQGATAASVDATVTENFAAEMERRMHEARGMLQDAGIHLDECEPESPPN